MQKRIPFFLSLIFCLVCKVSQQSVAPPIPAWGFFGHRLINRLAVYTLPDPLFLFYKKHLEYMEGHAVDPDKRRYAVVGEAECHFIDLDQYGDQPDSIIAALPQRWAQAVERYGEPSLRKHGIGPWNTYLVFLKLQKAFESKDLTAILKHSADLGHYVGDMHVPLHTTKNYNGQLTGQHGIHGLWESRLPELFSEKYKLVAPKATYLDKPQGAIWEVVFKSHTFLPAVFTIEDSLTQALADSKFSFETKAGVVQKVYSRKFSEKYQEAMGTMVEDRMVKSINFLGCIIYTAWVNAGQPDLSTLASRKNDKVLPDSLSEEVMVVKTREHE